MRAATARLCLVAAMLQAPTMLCVGHSAALPHGAPAAQRCPGRPALGIRSAGQLRGGTDDGSGSGSDSGVQAQAASRDELAMVIMCSVLRAKEFSKMRTVIAACVRTKGRGSSSFAYNCWARAIRTTGQSPVILQARWLAF